MTEQATHGSAEQARAGGSDGASGCPVLVVGASTRLAAPIRAALNGAGHPTRMAAGKRAALAALEREPAEVVLIEWATAGSDPVRLCSELRERPQVAAAHVIALIAEDASEQAPGALAGGADDYLQRPFELAELLTRVAAGVGTHLRLSEARALLADVSGVAYRCARDPDRTMELIGDEIERISGYPPADFIRSARRTFGSAIHPADRERVGHALAEAAEDHPFDLEYRILRADGGVAWVRERGQLVRTSDGGSRIEGAIVDVTDRLRAEAARRGAEERSEQVEQVIRDAPIGMALVGTDGRCFEANRTLCELTGYTEHELRGKRLDDLTDADNEADGDWIDQLLSGELRTHRLERRIFRADGHTLWVLLSVSLVKDGDGDPLYFIYQVQDISDRKRYESELQFLADHDALTGLFNRRRFGSEVDSQAALLKRYGGDAAVVMLDLDNFKDVNDSLGHQVGDDVIRTVASALGERVRETDVIARLGGDEFGVLLPETPEAEARHVAAALVRTVHEQTVKVNERDVRLTASAGVALLNGDPNGPEGDYLIEADLALYEAKDSGRDRLAVYGSGDGGKGRARNRLSWLERIRAAVENDHFLIHFQPIVDLATGSVSHYEALLRLEDQDTGVLLSPATFLYIPERFGMMGAIDRWVVHSALAVFAERFPSDVQLEINLSAQSLNDPELAALIERELAESELEPDRVIFEITETAAISNCQNARAFAERLMGLGCAFALDDFGSGFASFYTLKQLPYEYLKIDGDFIRALPSSDDDKLVVKALVDVARGMGKKTIAEFVGDEPTLSLLREYGVDYGQGFHLGHPQPVSTIAAGRLSSGR